MKIEELQDFVFVYDDRKYTIKEEIELEQWNDGKLEMTIFLTPTDDE